MRAFIPIVTLILTSFIGDCHGSARFQMSGPTLTLTLRDPMGVSSSSSTNNLEEPPNKWQNLSNLKPNLQWSLTSNKPLPNWLPTLQSFRATAFYDYTQRKNFPNHLEAAASFFKKGINLQVQPSISLSKQKKQATTWLVQIQKGTTNVFCKLANRGVELVRGSYQCDLPYASVGGVRVTPQLDLKRGEPSCLIEATTGSQRTKTVLNLEYNNPTLSIVHALDERHVIVPEISLYNAKIVYRWDIRLDSGNIQTRVDPTQAVHVTWTDKTDTGRWVTDFKLPLAGTTLSSLAADVRVRRQFTF